MNLESFNKPFEPQSVEPSRRQYWEQHKFYASVRDSTRKPYTIVMPPPNITGDLHMGHVLNNALQDILIRWKRASGYAVSWIPGIDHASIATEAKVTKLLADKGISKREIGRTEFLKHVWDWKKEYGGRIVGLLKNLGISCDWDRQVFTMDEQYSKSVTKAIVQLHRDGLIFRGHRLVNWCPVSQSVISDEEVIPEERNGHLWHIKYQIEGEPNRFVIVATTRPETLFGDLAVAVHPDDERYADLKGRRVIIPVCNRSVPVVFDAFVEKDFGTGIVKITPAHDKNDFDVGKRHNLGLLNIMNPDASLNNEVPEAYRGLDRYIARKKLVAELETLGAMAKIEPHRLAIGISERGKVPIEFYLSDQWYISTEKLSKIALNATRTQKLKLHPPHFEKVWEHWLTNCQDWCISRQLWWGHQMPMYNCSSCNHVMCAETAPIKCEKCGHDNLVQDPDCLDTWASAWLWAFAVQGWSDATSEQKKNLEYFFPTDIIVTAPDIIFFWIARMVMAGEYFMQKTPFKDVFFTPIIRDTQGRKMSKSLGNFPDVNGLLAKYGTDAIRFSIVNQLVPGQDINWADASSDIGRNFSNKIWNATRFLTMNCEKFGVVPEKCNFDELQASTDVLNSWMTSEFFNTVRVCTQAIDTLQFSQYTASIYEFTWMIFCDWYVELVKPRLAEGADAQLAHQTLTVAMQIFDGLLRLMHPAMPYITEEIWQKLGSRDGRTIGFEKMPTPRVDLENQNSLVKMREIQAVVGAIRTIRGQFTIHPGQELAVNINVSENYFGSFLPQLEFLAKAKVNLNNVKPVFSAASRVGELNLFVDLNGLVDPAAEKDRLTKKIEKLKGAIAGTEKRLSNEEFVKGAPEHIIAGAHAQLDANRQELALMQLSLQAVVQQ